MSKRTSASSSAPRKRRKGVSAIGAPNEDDNALNKEPTSLSSSSVSSRSIHNPGIPALEAMCTHVFALNLSQLYDGDEISSITRKQLQRLPQHLAIMLFEALKRLRPGMLSHAFISSYFLVGETVSLTSALAQVNRHTIQNLARMADTLRDLELSGFSDIPDLTFASTIKNLPNLRSVVLRSCTKVGDKTVTTLAATCPQLECCNLNYTSSTPSSLVDLLKACTQMQILKVAGLQKLGRDFLISLVTTTNHKGDPIGLQLRNLKLRLITTPDLSLETLLRQLPNLTKVDVSFTKVSHLPSGSGRWTYGLTKLNLTSTPIKPSLLPPLITHLPNLETLNIGALGGQSSASMTDDDLRDLTDALSGHCPRISKINLVGNAKLDSSSRPSVGYFIQKVGRRCQSVNLGSIQRLKSTALIALAILPEGEEEQGAPNIHDLNLSSTMIDDEATPYLAACTSLRRLNIANTKLSSEAVMDIIDSTPLLGELDLTACRGVRITDRRRFFEVWKENREVA